MTLSVSPSSSLEPAPSLAGIPSDIFDLVVRFLPDHEGICRLSSSCRLFRELVKENDDIWKQLHNSRWSVGNRNNIGAISMWKDDYVRRHGIDVCAVKILRDCVSQIVVTNPTETGTGTQNQDSRKVNVLDILASREEVYDVLRAIAIHDASNVLVRRFVSSNIPVDLLRYLAASMMVHTHRESVARRWGDLFSRSGGIEYQASRLTDGELLECGTLLLVEFYFPAHDLLEATSPQELLLCVTSQIDSLVNDFRSRIDVTPSSNEPSKDVRSKIQLLNEFLFSEVGFRGNVDNYYDYRNSLLNHVLDTKQGIPLSLSALYVCICRCIGVEHVDMIGLPGHFLLEIPSDDALDNNSNSRLFIDVFNGGRFLSIQDCRNIVASYGYPWGESMLEKVSPQLALKRMLNNLEQCHKGDKNMPLLMQLQLLRITERSNSNSNIMCEFLTRFPAVLFQESLSKQYLTAPIYLQVMHFFESQQLPNRH
eukprot:CAMPEP_0198287698 /NCGR_PEP_ID=MMETSP1449-20131203/6412_1 /TAXON_ID=420275 /ORGANISM="Attheya septentrionalis, Strain CCMP2084" /LENGTH=480 /DNA_ID=CAMNT_0043985679 /DNA_START=37 /DNA_END=1479 /DNA_ORIENTATION=-